MGIFSGSPTLRRRVQKRQYAAHTGDTKNSARSGKCSAPNLATSASSEAMLCLRSTCCQDSMRQILEVDHQVVAGGVVAREPGRLGVAAPLVKRAGGRVRGTGRRLDDDQASVF